MAWIGFSVRSRPALRLQHPHILGLLDSGEIPPTHDGGPALLYYAMPYVEGESLRGRLNRQRQLPLDEAITIAREVADALGYAHAHDVVHRDIKPENIMLSGGHAMVADFGIAKALTTAGGEKLTETGLALGTPYYMSPEQATGDTRTAEPMSTRWAASSTRCWRERPRSRARPGNRSWPGMRWIRSRAFGPCGR